MAFVLTLLYVAISLLSPSVLPKAVMSLHVNIILGVIAILAIIPQLQSSKIGKLPDSYMVIGLLVAAVLSMVPQGFSTLPTVVLDFIPVLAVVYFIAISCKSLFHIKVMVYVLLGVAFFIFLEGIVADRAHDLMSPYLMTEGRGAEMIIRYRGLGVLSDPNDLAQFFVTLIPLLWVRWKAGSYVSNFLFTIVPALILAAGMFYTHSRGGAIALVVLVLFGFKDKMGVVLSSILAAGMFIGLMALNISGGRGMSDDDGGRVAAWSTGLEIFRSHPLIGVGIGRFVEYNDTGHTAHNSYVLCLAEVGMIGYFFWLGTIVADLTELGIIVRSGKDDEGEKETVSPLPPYLMGQRTGALKSAILPEVRPVLSAAGAGTGAMLSAGYMPGGVVAPARAQAMPWNPAGIQIGRPAAAEDPNSEANVRYIAKVMRISFVGLMTAAFFLSRSFSMIFYIMLGMSAAVRLMYRRSHPEMTTDVPLLLKRIMMFLVGSVIFLYLFVRIRGVHG